MAKGHWKQDRPILKGEKFNAKGISGGLVKPQVLAVQVGGGQGIVSPEDSCPQQHTMLTTAVLSPVGKRFPSTSQSDSLPPDMVPDYSQFITGQGLCP